MKWFKMETRLIDDPRMVAIIDEYGMQAYGIFVAIHSIVARHSTHGTNFRYNTNKAFLRKNLGNFTKKTEKICKKLSNNFDFEFEISDKLITINIPNLLKLKDNYSKDLQETCKTSCNPEDKCLATPIYNKDVKDVKDTSLEPKHIDRNYDFDRDIEFENIWKRYPRKIGKPYARNKFMASVKTIEMLGRMNNALDAYISQVEADRNNGHPDLAYKHGRTWFSQWKEWDGHEIASEAASDARFNFLDGGNG